MSALASARAAASHVRTGYPGWTTGPVNLRSGPSTAYRVLPVLPARTKVAVLSRASGTHWYRSAWLAHHQSRATSAAHTWPARVATSSRCSPRATRRTAAATATTRRRTSSRRWGCSTSRQRAARWTSPAAPTGGTRASTTRSPAAASRSPSSASTVCATTARTCRRSPTHRPGRTGARRAAARAHRPQRQRPLHPVAHSLRSLPARFT